MLCGGRGGLNDGETGETHPDTDYEVRPSWLRSRLTLFIGLPRRFGLERRNQRAVGHILSGLGQSVVDG